ncbi:hypothetical protein K431DRAFT_309337 [Polychaeton citri CBS 116435]|uniref:F-box domain-containing protein n=1 Tax=Polychaeton citri CBS 116435 TaxID=1314669 RepID=A0A9P4QHT6_9PEZI|nr:hypothetical protein K431DRAFT_309337 [Polychaeton citri CBS 116435]
MAFRILDLPNELIVSVTSHLDKSLDLQNLALTCKRLQTLTEPSLYNNIFFRSDSQLTRLIDSIATRQHRARSIRGIECRCLPKRWNSDIGFERLPSLLAHAVNTKDFVFESPHCNDSKFEGHQKHARMQRAIFESMSSTSSQNISQPSLQHLQRLTIHMNGPGSPYWTLDGNSNAIVTHPTLQELTVSCVNITVNCTANIKDNFVPTSLKKLVLDECNITPDGLLNLLTLPKALSHLHLGENFYNSSQFPDHIDTSFNNLFRRYPQLTMQALNQQSASLESLTYVTHKGYDSQYEALNHPQPPESAFSNFGQLQDVRLIGDCRNFERAICKNNPPPALARLHCCGEPELLTFKLAKEHVATHNTDEYQRLVANIPFLKHTSVLPPGLKSFGLTFDRLQNDWTMFAAPPPAQPFETWLATLEKLARYLLQYEAVLNVDTKHRNLWIPPLLYGEEDGIRVPLLTSDTSGAIYKAQEDWEAVYGDSDDDIDDFDEGDENTSLDGFFYDLEEDDEEDDDEDGDDDDDDDDNEDIGGDEVADFVFLTQH